MKINSIAALIMLLPLASMAASEISYECPPEMTTIQTLKDKAPEGWTPHQVANARHSLDSIMIFDGPPVELASLVPNNESNKDNRKTFWTFVKKKERPIWFTCSYLKTDIVFAKSLPLDITQCRMLLSKNKVHSITGLICE
jgi:hypothetical protein